MFKLVILSAILAIAAAAPSFPEIHEIEERASLRLPTVETAVISEPAHVEIRKPVITKVGDIIQSVPSAVSHHSSSVVHKTEKIVTPIVAHGVKTTVKTVETPVLKTISAPIVTREPFFRFDTPIVYTTPLRSYGAHALLPTHLNYAPYYY